MIDSEDSWPWGPISERDTRLSLPGNGLVHIYRYANLLKTLVENEDEPKETKPHDITIVGENDVLSYTPELPDKPVVLRSAHILRIAPRSIVETKVPIPLVPTITVLNPKGEQDLLLRLPLSGLSKTWFGDPKSGESAFSLSSPLDEVGLSEDFGPWVASCPLVIRNTSSEVLSFERLIIRVGLLSMFVGNNRLYTNQLTVKFRGQSHVSQIHIASKGPQIDESPEPLTLFCGPRKNKDRFLLNRSFSFIKSLATD